MADTGRRVCFEHLKPNKKISWRRAETRFLTSMFSSLRGSSNLLRSLISRPQQAGRWISHPPILSTRTYVTSIWKNMKNSELSDSLSRSKELYKTYKPITPGIRHLKRPLNPHLYAGRPVRFLTVAKRKKGGRNNSGKITVRHRGGGHKRRIRTVDFKRMNPGIHDVVRIEYDPNRSAHIALLHNRDPAAVGSDKWSYIIATDGMRAGDNVQSFRQGIPDGFIPGFKEKEEGDEPSTENSAQILALGLLRSMTLKPGNVLPLRLIPPGTVINTISLKPNGPGILVRSAGSFGQVVAQDEGNRYVHVRLQSGEVRKILRDCCATIGKVSNSLWKNRSLGKAGRSRWLGIRPAVRGVAMNAFVSFFFHFVLCDLFPCHLVMTILMEVGVESLSLTSTRYRYGVGEQKAQGRGSLDLRDRRTVTRWLFVSGQEGKRSKV